MSYARAVALPLVASLSCRATSTPWRALGAALGGLMPLAAWSQAPAAAPTTLAHCAAIGTSVDRLACYDRLANRAPAPVEPAAEQPAVGTPSAIAAATGTPPGTTPAPTTTLVPKDAPLPENTAAATLTTSLLSKYWELEPADRRGIFNFVGYQPNYVLPVHLTNHVNRAPSSPTQAAVLLPDYRRYEAKFQLSLRTKLVQDTPGIGGDLWAAFSQQAFWQIYNGQDSKPFRNTDYQPELTYVRAIPTAWSTLPFGWRWRYAQAGLAHESNGQSDPLSRSWNRYYLGTGLDRGDWAFTFKFNQRIAEDPASDNNPDLVEHRGRGELALIWAHGPHTALLEYRTTLKSGKYGAVRFEYTYPIFRDQPNGLRWFVQGFSGYGETLTDYNFRQTSLGVGVSFLQF